MSEGIFYRCKGRAEAVEVFGTEYEAWQAAHVEAMVVRDMEGWANDCLLACESSRRLHQEVCQIGEKHGFVNPAAVGGVLMRLFNSTISLLTRVVNGVDSVERRGYEVERAAELREALTELQRQRAAFAKIWPTDGALWERAGADIQAGRMRTLSEARDELRRRRSGCDS